MSDAIKQSPTEVVATAKSVVRAHLPEIALEILTWRDTGLLPDGKLRDVSTILKQFAGFDHLAIAEKLAVDAALEAVSAKRNERNEDGRDA